MAKKKENTPDDPEQTHLPGMEPVYNKRVHPKAKRYAELRNARMEANEEEKSAHDNLLAVMLEEGLEHYEYNGVRVDIDATKKCKVKIAGEGTGGETEE